MATKEVIHTDSSNGIALVLVVVLIIGAFFAYQQGMFTNEKSIEINLPNGKGISSTISE
jgi:predicted negative regulator of RcsB-dependent stress response